MRCLAAAVAAAMAGVGLAVAAVAVPVAVVGVGLVLAVLVLLLGRAHRLHLRRVLVHLVESSRKIKIASAGGR